MDNKEEKIIKKHKNDEKIYIQEEEEVEEIDEEEGEVEEIDEDSQIGIQILDDSLEKKKHKKSKKESESEEYESEETPKDKNNSTQNDNENENDNLRRKRRRRKEFSGPGYKCPDCGKSYFSMPALNTHRKTKHDFLKKGGGRGRGRPRKEPLIIHPEVDAPQIQEISKNQENVISYSKIESKLSHFFDEDNRKPIYGEIINRNVILDIINNYKKNFHNIISFTDNKKFYQKIMEEWGDKSSDSDKKNNENMTFINLINYKTPTKLGKGNDYININDNNIEGNHIDDNKTKTFDEAIARYLKECSNLTNINFLRAIFYIIILFRDSINNYFNETKLINNDKNIPVDEEENNYKDIYTDKNNCNDEIPGLINNIINKYFEPNSFFAIKQKDVKDIILHFFHWLYTYNYTDKKVTHT